MAVPAKRPIGGPERDRLLGMTILYAAIFWYPAVVGSYFVIRALPPCEPSYLCEQSMAGQFVGTPVALVGALLVVWWRRARILRGLTSASPVGKVP